jgi:hypothetical protein
MSYLKYILQKTALVYKNKDEIAFLKSKKADNNKGRKAVYYKIDYKNRLHESGILLNLIYNVKNLQRKSNRLKKDTARAEKQEQGTKLFNKIKNIAFKIVHIAEKNEIENEYLQKTVSIKLNNYENVNNILKTIIENRFNLKKIIIKKERDTLQINKKNGDNLFIKYTATALPLIIDLLDRLKINYIAKGYINRESTPPEHNKDAIEKAGGKKQHTIILADRNNNPVIYEKGWGRNVKPIKNGKTKITTATAFVKIAI